MSGRLPHSGPLARPAPDGYLFVCGCQRSGTTALMHLLNADPRIVVGRERFKYCREHITPEVFTPERFFRPTAAETNYRVPEFYEQLRTKWNTGAVRYIGDKVPFYYKDLPGLVARFDACKVIFIVRDLERVAASYNARAANPEDLVWKPTMDYRVAVDDWNESLRCVRDFVEAGHGSRLFIVPYERLFSGEMACLEALFGFLGLQPDPSVTDGFAELTADWEARRVRPLALTPEARDFVASRRDTELEMWCLGLQTTGQAL